MKNYREQDACNNCKHCWKDFCCDCCVTSIWYCNIKGNAKDMAEVDPHGVCDEWEKEE